jgi:peptidyl-prolyl cis-trans isomerase C
MNRFTKQTALVAVLAAALTQTPVARAAAASAPTDDPPVATGKGFVVTRSQLDDAFVSYNTSVAANGGSIPEDQRSEIRSNLLDHLIITKILNQMATADDKATIKKMVDDNIAEARKSAPSPEIFDAQIKASGMTLEQVRQRAFEEQLSRHVLERAATNGINITDDQAKKFYDDNPDKFEVPEEVHVSHILISTLQPPDPLNPSARPQPLPPDKKKAQEQLARQVKALADKGSDWGKLVKQYSDDPGSKDKGGEYTFPRNRMVPEFEAAAFSLKTNQISDIVETQYGYHIIKLLEKFPAKKESFADSKDKIKTYLADREGDKAIPAFLAKIKAQYAVAIVDQGTTK